MRITIPGAGVPGKLWRYSWKKGGTGDLIVDNPGEFDCNGPAGVSK
jgi:hypothetical protein